MRSHPRDAGAEWVWDSPPILTTTSTITTFITSNMAFDSDDKLQSMTSNIKHLDLGHVVFKDGYTHKCGSYGEVIKVNITHENKQIAVAVKRVRDVGNADINLVRPLPSVCSAA